MSRGVRRVYKTPNGEEHASWDSHLFSLSASALCRAVTQETEPVHGSTYGLK